MVEQPSALCHGCQLQRIENSAAEPQPNLPGGEDDNEDEDEENVVAAYQQFRVWQYRKVLGTRGSCHQNW